jgi:hypothetical protein
VTPLRLAAIAFIYVFATVAWLALGTSVVARSGEFDHRLSQEVALVWGGPHRQAAPDLYYEVPRSVTETVQRPGIDGKPVEQQVTRLVTDRVPLAVTSSRVEVELALEHRRKGLLWYDTYGVRLRGTYRASNTDAAARTMFAHLAFPSDHVQFDNFVFRINGRDAERARDLSKGATVSIDVPPGGDVLVEVGYDSRGLDRWAYTFAGQGVAEVHDFQLTMRTDFDGIDFPAGTMSPSSSTPRNGGGQELVWTFTSLLTGRHIGVDLPNRTNPGPLTARITYFAPVSLLFFLTVLVVLGVLRSESLHPMHYAFLSAGFFAFHLLLAYLVDHLTMPASFAIASMTSVALVVSYLMGVAGSHFAVARAGLAQFVFLVLFSLAFFFEGYTGLTVTVGAILTLFVLMQLTARVDWAAVMARQPDGARGRS